MEDAISKLLLLVWRSKLSREKCKEKSQEVLNNSGKNIIKVLLTQQNFILQNIYKRIMKVVMIKKMNLEMELL